MSVDSIEAKVCSYGKSIKWYWAIPIVALGLILVSFIIGRLEPSYAGKSVCEWFEEAVRTGPTQLWNRNPKRRLCER